MTKRVNIKNISVGKGCPLVFIAGPCVIESYESCLKLAEKMKIVFESQKISFIFKASYDKANRTSVNSYRGPGVKEGMKILSDIKKRLDIPVLSDVHCKEDIPTVAGILDVIQIPAFLCRQTDLILSAGKTGKPINIKKGQFLAPWDMKAVVEKIQSTGNEDILLTERGTCFGYNNLVSDMRSLVIMRELGYPVIYDATHSVQLPGGQGNASGGERNMVAPLARAAVATGCDGVFLEVHETPEKALSDAKPPDYLILPKIHVQKGLPFGIDVGAVFSTVPGSNITLFGGEVKYAVLKGSIVSPAVAVRGTYTTLSGVDDIDASTYSLDASVSKGFGPITPYAGLGQVWISASENVNDSLINLDDVSTSATKLFLGAKLKILLVSIVLQADISDVNMYSARANVSF